MKRLDQKIGFIGAGNMGEAMIGALLRSGISFPEEILISDPNRERLAHIQNRYAVGIAQHNLDLFLQSQIVILAVKPQTMEPVVREITNAPEYRSASDTKLVISIAAGVTLQKLEALFYAASGMMAPEKLPIIRVMPNTPALVLSGMSGMSGNRHASPADLKTARIILEAMGSAVEVKESDMDAVTAVSGSGPAYVFFLAESMIEAGIVLGLDPDTAITLTLKTMEGALKLLQESTDTPEALRKKVTSPGGTTEAAFQVLSANRIKAVMVEAISRAAARSRELSGN